MCSLYVQKILKLDLFPDSVFETEMKYYMTKLNEVCRSTAWTMSVAEKIIVVLLNDSMEYLWIAVRISQKLIG